MLKWVHGAWIGACMLGWVHGAWMGGFNFETFSDSKNEGSCNKEDGPVGG